MQTYKLIGSILTFKTVGITQYDLSIIRAYSDRYNLNLLQNYDLPTVAYELYDYDDCFNYETNRIKLTKYYKYNISKLKGRFFDVLSEDEKDIIYDILNII